MDSDNETSSPRGVRVWIQDSLPAFMATLVGGIVAMGVNAPLKSPDDLIGNAGSVAVASVIAALVAGSVWAQIKGDIQRRAKILNIVLTALLVVVVVAAALIENFGEISNTIRYVIPLAAIVTIFASLFTPIIERWRRRNALLWIAVVLPIVMLATGFWLTSNEFGFTEAPSLSLPPAPK